jgi:hypothetical protein
MMLGQDMPLSFTMRLPLDGRFQSIGTDIARKYAELAGGAAPDAEELARSLSQAVASLSAGVSPDESVDFGFVAGAQGLEITLRCAGRSAVVTHSMPAPKR